MTISPKNTSTSTPMQLPTPPQTSTPAPPPSPNPGRGNRVISGIVSICALVLFLWGVSRITTSPGSTLPTPSVDASGYIREKVPTKPPPPIAPTSTPTPTPTPTSITQAEDNSLFVLCASNAVDQYNHRFPSAAYGSLNRYATADRDVSHPDINRILKSLYASSSLKLGDCSDPRKILKTQSASHIDNINMVKFNVDTSLRIKQYWILMTARDTATIDPSMLDPVGAIYSECADTFGTLTKPPARVLRLGDDIADWTFRGIHHDDSEDYTIAYLRSTAKDVRRVFIGYDLGAAQATSTPIQTTDNRTSGTRLRAAQMFAVLINLDACEGQLKSITIEDTSAQAGLDILAAVLVPEGFPELTSVPKVTDEAPICLKSGISSPDVDDRGLLSDVEDISSLEPVRIGCEKPNYNIFPEIAQNVHFSINRILATYPDAGVLSAISPKITLNTTNTISATHLYLLLSARNMCVTPNFSSEINVIGQIKINDGLPLSLRIGDNVRQGRTNLVPSDTGCSSGADALYMNPVNQQQDAPMIAGYPGIPLRAKRNDRVHVEAELWLDLLKIPLPKGSTNIKIEIENALGQADAGEKPFITLYAATLVTEEP